MSYLALARKWRPQTFADVIGQEHVVRALTHALARNQLHHAYLFTGTRGVGKTTLARIFAKCLNCETGVTPEPCGECGACREIAEGRFVDMIEVDAASRTKVEQTRELLENVQYAPTGGRFKVYVIDEVHMLSDSSFNALLKTLEEPPPHVKFLLATTDPQKIPPTVLSRCLQFSLKNMATEPLVAHLETVLAGEGIPVETPALWLLARAARGSVRDALSLADQAIAFGDGAIEEQDVADMLGAIDRDAVYRVLTAVARDDGAAVLSEVAGLVERGADLDALLTEILSVLHRVALVHGVPGYDDNSEGDLAAVQSLAECLDAEDAQLFYQIALQGRRDLPLAPEPRTALEMTLLRMLAFALATTESSAEGGDAGPVPAKKKPERATRSGSDESSVTVQAKAAPVAATTPPVEATGAGGDTAMAQPAWLERHDWASLTEMLPLSGVVRQIAAHCVVARADEQSLELILDRRFDSLHDERHAAAIAEALQACVGQSVRVSVVPGDPGEETPAQRRQRRQSEKRQAAEAALCEDPNVRALQQRFGAVLDRASVQSLDASGETVH